MFGETLREEVGERRTLRAALPQVRANQGSPGSEGMSVNELPAGLKTHWPALTEQLLGGTYHPRVSKGGKIPKPGSRAGRKLGIPWVVAGLIQQALRPVLHRHGDSTFSDSS